MNKAETYQYLRDHGIKFEVTEHAAVFNMAEVDTLDLPYRELDAKNLFVRDKKKNHYLICVKGDRRVDLKAFRKKHGLSGLSFGSEEDLMTMLGLIPGAVTPLGLLNDKTRSVGLFLDQSLMGGIIGVHPNDNTATVWMQAGDLVRLLEEDGHTVQVVEI